MSEQKDDWFTFREQPTLAKVNWERLPHSTNRTGSRSIQRQHGFFFLLKNNRFYLQYYPFILQMSTVGQNLAEIRDVDANNLVNLQFFWAKGEKNVPKQRESDRGFRLKNRNDQEIR